MDIEDKAVSVSEHVDDAKSEDENLRRINIFTEQEQKKIIRRCDIRLVITLGAMYCVSLIDRTNLGSAAIAGMNAELVLTINNRYSIVNLVFFITYVIFQPLTVVAIRKIGPRIFLAVIVGCWGVVMLAFGFVHEFYQLAILRVLLGAFEAGFFPGAAYLLSTWYPRYELAKRNGGFFIIGQLASGFSGILAYGLMQMAGLGGLSGWRWIFIIEGIVTCIIAMMGYLFLVDFPELSMNSWRFLNETEAQFIVAKIDIDRQDSHVEPFHLPTYLRGALDLKIWGFAAIFMCSAVNAYSIAFFLPLILRGMGFSIAASQCLTAPPYVVTAVVIYVEAYYSDKWHTRGWVLVLNASLGIIGLGVLGYVNNLGARYFGVFLAVIAGNGNIPAVLSYQAANVRGQWVRALSSATLVGTGGIGGIIGSLIYREQDAPTYGPGLLGTLLCNALVIVVVGLLTIKFYRANKRVVAGGKIIGRLEGFRYTL